MAEQTSEKGLIAKLADAQAAPPWGLGEVALALMVLFIGILIIGTTITASVSTSTVNPEPISFVMGWLIGLGVVILFVLVRWRRTKEHFDALRLVTGHWNPILAFLVGIGGAFTATVLAGLGSGDFIAPMQVLGIDSSIGSLLLVGLFVLIVQPIAECLVFYAVAMPKLRAYLGGWAGLITTMLLYAIYYFLVFGSRASGGVALWYGAIYPLIIAFTLGAVRIWSKSTLMSILAQIGIGVSILFILLVT